MEKTKSIFAVLTLSFFIICSTQLRIDMEKKASAKAKTPTYTSSTSKEKVIPTRSTATSTKKSTAGVKKEKVATASAASVKKTQVSKTSAAKKKTSTAKTSTAKSTAKTTAKKTASTKAKKTTSTKKSASTSRTTTPSRGGRTTYSPEKAGQVIEYAKNFMGVKYVFGGASSSGFDCSGFTMYVFKSIGVDLPHSATSQSKMGTPVGRDELKPGDLVFFETYKKGISHVGIYVGNGSFIEASSSRGIAVTSLSSSYYAPRYKGAVRILK